MGLKKSVMETCVLYLLSLVNGKARSMAYVLGVRGLCFCTGFLEVEARINMSRRFCDPQ